jgi:hypothetical protein
MEMASSQSLSSSAGHVDLGRETIGTFGDKLTNSFCNPVNSEGKRLKLSAAVPCMLQRLNHSLHVSGELIDVAASESFGGGFRVLCNYYKRNTQDGVLCEAYSLLTI